VESLESLIERLKSRNHLGGAGNLGLEQISERLQQAQVQWQQRTSTFETTIEQLVGLPTTRFAKE
jgi:argininosuccinate lyase